MSKNQVNITYYQFNIKLKLFNNSITKEKYAFWLYFYAFGQKLLTNIFISFLIKLKLFITKLNCRKKSRKAMKLLKRGQAVKQELFCLCPNQEISMFCVTTD